MILPRLVSLCAFAAALVLVTCPTALAESLEERLLANAKDGQLDQFDFILAGLIASGVQDAGELSAWTRSYGDVRGQVIGRLSEPLSQSQRLQVLHTLMHEQMLTGQFQSAATDLRITLARGDFNCLSAVSIYLDLCQAAGIEMEIWLAPGHVWLRSTEADAGTIEPGSPEWSEERHRDSIGRLMPPPRHARQITPVELLGKFYYNRGVEHLQQQDFARGLALLSISRQLDPLHDDARENLLAGINNWAVEHCRAERYQEAIALIRQGLAISPSFGPLVANERFVREKLGR